MLAEDILWTEAPYLVLANATLCIKGLEGWHPFMYEVHPAAPAISYRAFGPRSISIEFLEIFFTYLVSWFNRFGKNTRSWQLPPFIVMQEGSPRHCFSVSSLGYLAMIIANITCLPFVQAAPNKGELQ